jgi:uroporphyrinogen decarboxylase
MAKTSSLAVHARRRVRAALARRPADRVPIWLWLHPETTRRVAAHLRIAPAAVADVLGDDIRQAWVANNYAMEGIVHEHDGDTHTDDWGIEWVKDGPFNQIRRYPLEHADEAAVRAYRFPYERVPALLATLEPVVARRAEYFIGCDVSPCVFEMACRLRGMEGALLDLAEAPALAAHLLGECAAFAQRLAEDACARFPLDWLWTGDDVGGQQALMLSPAQWREFVKPHLARIVAVGKARGLPVAFHCCGAIRPIIPDLIEIGVDVLNPVQCNCPGMDPLELKREFGRSLAFMGGVDTQRLLPCGTPREVRHATERLLAGMTADGGGYILAASHAVPPETPLDNLFALYEAAGIPRAEILARAADRRA